MKRINRLLVLIAAAALIIPATLLAREVPTGYVWIQSEKAVGRGHAGFWDVPGGGKDTQKLGKKIQSWKLDKGSDRKFRFIEKNGRYAIRIANGRYVAPSGFRKGDHLRVSNRPYYFKVEHQGRGRYRISTSSGKIVCLEGKSYKNGKNVHLWTQHNGPHTRWVFYNPNTRRSYVPRTSPATERNTRTASSGASVTLQQALLSKNYVKTYFERVTINQYREQRGDGYLQEHLNNERKASDQWIKFYYAVQGANQNNNRMLRHNIYKDLQEVTIKKSSNFLMNSIKNKYGSNIRNLGHRERNKTLKTMLFSLADKFK